MGQSLLSCDPLVWVNLQHLLQQVYSHWVGSLEHNLEILRIHLGEGVYVIFSLELISYLIEQETVESY